MPDLLSAFRDALLDFLAPALEAAVDPVARAAWFSQLGYTASVSGAPELSTIFSEAGALRSELSSLDLSSLDSLGGLQTLLQTGRHVQSLMAALKQFGNDPSLAGVATQLGEEVMALLLASYLRRRHMTLFRFASVLSLIDAAETSPPAPPIVQNGATIRFSPYYDQFNFNAVSALVSNPASVLRQYYFPNNLQHALDARVAAARVFVDFGLLADAIGLSWRTSYAPSTAGTTSTTDSDDGLTVIAEGDDSGEDDPNTDPLDSADGIPLDTSPLPDAYFASTFPGFRIVILSSAAAPGSEVALELQCSSASHPGAVAGFIASVVGNFNSVTTFDAWRATLTGKGQIPAFVLKPDGFALAQAASPLAGGAASIALDRLPSPGSTGPVFVFGTPSGTRLEIGTVSLRGDLSFDPAHIAVSVGAKAAMCAFVLRPGDGDGFLSSVLPQNGLTARFDLGLTFSSDGGLSIQGGAGMDVTLPIGISIGGNVSIPSLHLALTSNGGGLQTEISCSAALSIGPVGVLIDRIGTLLAITFPAGGGNFGPIDLAVNFKPPSGAGLSIDAAGVSGGGFLAFDSAKHQYSGVLQLKFTEFALQAFGVITTQVAGGSGYSLIALVDADFPPIQLGWGFTLNGVGGLFAVHRTADVDALRAALKADKLSTILFPRNAVSNAAQILAQLDALFPTAAGRFLFGPMALIGWGTPNVLTVALAVILELPEPVRIILLARLALRLPSDSTPLIRINMDALGVLDLSQDLLSLDATLYDSRIMGFALTGDMALRANWSSQREFLLAIGGFHPQFTPPAGFPTLQRITINMPSGPIAKLRLAAYLAVSSNTVQFGATLDVFIGVAGFGLAGHLGFDALLQVSPFHFDADISGSVSLTADGDDLMSVELDATLSGPSPWNIAGNFKIHIIFFDVHKSFSYSWGASTQAPAIPAVNALPLLSAAFADSRNWGITLPDSEPNLVSLRSEDGSALIAHPLAELEVHQSVAPLDLQIERFGAAPLAGASTFTITDFRLNNASLLSQTTPVEDDFAPAQFFNLSDNEKLAGPSFEQHAAGCRLVSPPSSIAPLPLSKTIAYETFYIDKPGAIPRAEAIGTPKSSISAGDLTKVLYLGASARAGIRTAGKLRYQAPGKPISIAPAKFTLSGTGTLAPAGLAPAGGLTYTEAKALRAKAMPALQAQLQILATHEMAAS